jgi:hypothetical protein
MLELLNAQCMHLFDQKFTQIHVKILDSLDHQSLESSPHTTPKWIIHVVHMEANHRLQWGGGARAGKDQRVHYAPGSH